MVFENLDLLSNFEHELYAGRPQKNRLPSQMSDVIDQHHVRLRTSGHDPKDPMMIFYQDVNRVAVAVPNIVAYESGYIKLIDQYIYIHSVSIYPLVI